MTTIIKVLKRDNTTEDFNPDKIKKVVRAAGLGEEQASKLVKNVSNWAIDLKKESITSLEIRDKVLEELERLDKPVADLFRWYQKTKDHQNHSS